MRAGMEGMRPGLGPDGGNGGGGAVDSVTSPDNVVQVSPTSGNVVVNQHLVATWGSDGSTRFFAIDSKNGNDANAGFSDVTQAAAGLVAKKSISSLLQIVPKFGNGRKARIAIRAGSYAGDVALRFVGFTGYKDLLLIGTDSVASAGAIAFAGDGNDTLCAGMTTATGANAAGYNPTAYVVSGDGTPTITLQLNGGGPPAFAAPPSRPYGSRLRFDVNSTTVALRNVATTVLNTSGSGSLILSTALPASPVVGDVCYIEMPNVTGLTATDLAGTSAELAGLALGNVGSSTALNFDDSSITFSGCDCDRLLWTGGQINCTPSIATFSPFPTTGYTLRSGGGVITGAVVIAAIGSGWCDTGAFNGGMVIEQPVFLLLEAFAAKALYVEGGEHAPGFSVVESVGTNASTAHGATSQIWGVNNGSGLTCGLALHGGYTVGRIRFSNQGPNPAIRSGGAGSGILLYGASGGVADGNTDVGLDLTPVGAFDNNVGSMGLMIALVGNPSVTGTVGDVRLPNGQITTWAALLATGLADTEGNRFISASGPLATVKSFSGVLINSEGAGSSFLADYGIGESIVPTNPQPDPCRYPTSLRLITRLRGCVPLGTTAGQSVTFTLYKNGVATAQTCAIAASQAAGAKAVDLAHPILFADGDDFDVFASGTINANLPISATLEGPC